MTIDGCAIKKLNNLLKKEYDTIRINLIEWLKKLEEEKLNFKISLILWHFFI